MNTVDINVQANRASSLFPRLRIVTIPEDPAGPTTSHAPPSRTDVADPKDPLKENRIVMTFKNSATDRYFEDYSPGDVHQFGSITVTESEIIEFARSFDPQPFHTDPEAARQSPFGGLIASGWHTVSLAMRLLVDHYISRAASLGSPGADELRWRKPVRPGDTLSLRVTILESKLSRSKPDQGTIRTYIEVLNQHHETVMTWKGIGLLRCRNKTDARTVRQ